MNPDGEGNTWAWLAWAAALIFVMSLLMIVHAAAHDWYPMNCCSSKDCHPIDDCSELTDAPDGGIDWKGYHFTKDRVKPSQDSKCHVCIYTHPGTYGSSADGKPYENPMCVFIQQGS